MLTLYATIRNKADISEKREVQAEGVDYDTARAQLLAQIPDGWQNVGTSRWPAVERAAED
ncbi:hypothetical protein [Nocardioides sp.]|uniref:hypothetical protein n=1 Tax=Nocardioides sp. TaxID=35761 RepID=UPI00262C5FCA|nr:hypothetical protein [Nocardioides sp.]